MNGRITPRLVSRALVAVALTPILLAVAPASASAQADTTPEEELARRYVPVMMLQVQPDECDPQGEPFTPMSVEAVLDNPQVALRQVGADDPVVTWGPSAQDLFGLGQGFYLDYPGIALDPGCLYERDYRAFTADLAPTVYAHVVVQPDHPDRLTVQYWFFWYYNDWNNKHEGDWEGIQVVFPASTAEEALLVEPIEVGYSQHSGGERADWDDAKLERDGDRPVVYTSQRSHASYYGSALYLGRNGSEGFGCDDTGGPTHRVDPDVVLLPDAIDDPDSDLAWLAFLGRWGERGEGAYNGPTGPSDKGRWLNPIDRQESLRPDSVVVPAGDGRAAEIADLFCDVVGWASNQVLSIKLNPVRGVIAGAILLGIVLFAIRRTEWSLVDPLPIVRRRRLGQIFRASLRIFAKNPLTYLMVGLLGLPFVLLVGVIATVFRALPGIGELLSLSDDAGGITASVILSGLTGLIALVLIVAVVAWIVRESEQERRATFRNALDAVRARIGDLVEGLVRAVLIVCALVVSIVGLPWGLRQLFRYQFLAQATMLEGRSGPGALSRSSRLVRGRWWHTALVVTILNGAVVVVAGAIGLLVLVTLRPPFWVLTALILTIEVLAFPLVAIILTLVYGDAVAEHSADEAPAVEDSQLVGTSA